MDLMDAIKGRRSVRRFKNQAIPNELITQLIEAATSAPSAGNIQPWEFVIVKNSITKEKLLKASHNQVSIQEAPVVIVVCADQQRSSTGYGNRGETLYCLQDTAAAIQNILLTAHSLGLGTCWIGSFNEDEAKEAVKAPDGVRPIAMIPVGYPNVTPRQRSRRPVSEVVHQDRF